MTAHCVCSVFAQLFVADTEQARIGAMIDPFGSGLTYHGQLRRGGADPHPDSRSGQTQNDLLVFSHQIRQYRKEDSDAEVIARPRYRR